VQKINLVCERGFEHFRHSFAYRTLNVAGAFAKEPNMVGLAAAMFVGLFAFGYQFFGWSHSAHEQLQLGLFLSFVLGIVCGYKTRG
jgi:hypothetical protein